MEPMARVSYNVSAGADAQCSAQLDAGGSGQQGAVLVSGALTVLSEVPVLITKVWCWCRCNASAGCWV